MRQEGGLRASRRCALRLGAMLAVIASSAAPALGQAAPRAVVDPARTTSGYGALLPVRGQPQAARAAAPRGHDGRYCRAVAYAAATDSDSLLVWRDGRMVLARDFGRYDASSQTWSASMSKTLVALALGIAIRDGAIASVDVPVATYLTEWTDAAHRRITFRDLLEMTSGLDHPAGGSAASRDLLSSDDVIAHALALPAVAAPGVDYDYSTVNVTLLIEAIRRATGTPFPAFLSAKLWAPLGAGDALLSGDRTGHAVPSLFATARDWLRIGILLEQRGRWQGRQIVPAAWIDRMTVPSRRNANYGWLTWLGSPPPGGRSYGSKVAFKAIHSAPFAVRDMVFLDGFGGQRVYVVPSRKLVIVRTGANRMDWDDAILPNAVLQGLSGPAEPCPPTAP